MRINIKTSCAAAFVVGAVTLFGTRDAHSQGTAFTYQGQLTQGTTNAIGIYDLTFALFNASSGGVQVCGTITDNAVGITNGLFTLLLDFGSGVFNGTVYWLQIGVRPSGVGLFTALAPRQELTPTPYSITSENVDGPVPASQLSGTLGTGVFPIPLDLSGSIAAPILEADQAGAGPAILGSRTAATGTSAGVQGITGSTAASANAVYGVVSSTGPGSYSAGVRGQNNGTGGEGVGVYGSHAGSGWGVYGSTPSGIGVYGNCDSGVGVDGQSYSWIGVRGSHTAGTGTAAGVQGITASTNGNAYAVYGSVSSTSPGDYSAGVRGENKGTGGAGIGVYGSQAGGGWGVYGFTPNGIGVYGASGSGTGVYASGGNGTALNIASGAIQVSGAGLLTHTAAFVQLCTATNQTMAHRTTIDNPACNGNPGAILLVTHNFNPPGASANLQTAPFGVFYNSGAAKWEIFNENFVAMAVGTTFNVLVIKP